jgi:hypothetical protein
MSEPEPDAGPGPGDAERGDAAAAGAETAAPIVPLDEQRRRQAEAFRQRFDMARQEEEPAPRVRAATGTVEHGSCRP